MAKPRSKKQIHQDIDNYVIVNEEIIGNVPAGKFKNTISFDGIIHPGTPMTINQLAALIAKLTTTVNDQHNLVMGEIKVINGEIKSINSEIKAIKSEIITINDEIKVIKHDIVDIKQKLGEHDKKFELVFSILDSHTKIFARNNLK